jgi:hypothetical protein
MSHAIKLAAAARDYLSFVMLRPPHGTPARESWDALAQALTAYRASEIKDSELAPGEDARPPFAGVGVAAMPSEDAK